MQKSLFRASAVLAGALAMSSGSNAALAQDAEAEPGISNQNPEQMGAGMDPGASKLSDSDRKMFEKVARQNMDEISLAQLAVQKTRNTSVRSFAQQMITDHRRAEGNLRAFAKQKGLNMPTTVDPSTIDMHSKLMKLNGENFDKEFVNAAIDMHKEALSTVQDVAKDAKDPAFKQWAVQTVPTLTDHLASAEALKRQLDVKGGDTQGSDTGNY